MNKELKAFEHIIKILVNRDGWIKIPLFTKQEVENAKSSSAH